MALATSTIIGLSIAGAVGSMAYSAVQSGKANSAMKSLAAQAGYNMPVATAPKVDPVAAQKAAQEAATKRNRAMARSKSVRTSPLGLAGEADVARKTLLGQ